MYKNVSDNWYENIYKNNQSIINVYFDEILVNSNYITSFKVGNTLFDNELELGVTPCQYIELQIHKKANIGVPKQIRVEYGVLIGEDFEIIPIGIYNVDDFDEEDENIINIKALDNMIKLNANDGYYDASEVINENGYATLKQIAQDICNKKGLKLRFQLFS